MRSFKKSTRSIKNFRKKSRKRNIRKRTNRKQIAGAGAFFKRFRRPLISPIRLKNFRPFKKRHRQYTVTPSIASNMPPPVPFRQRPEVLSGDKGMNQIYAHFSDVRRQKAKRQNTNAHSGELIYDTALGPPPITRKNKPQFPIYVTPNKKHTENLVYADLKFNSDTQYPPPLHGKIGNSKIIYARFKTPEEIRVNNLKKTLRGKPSEFFENAVPKRTYDTDGIYGRELLNN